MCKEIPTRTKETSRAKETLQSSDLKKNLKLIQTNQKQSLKTFRQKKKNNL